MTSNIYAEFSAALDVRQALLDSRWSTIQAMQAEYETALRAEYKRLYPKHKQPAQWCDVNAKLPEEIRAAIYDPRKTAADKFAEESHAAEKALDQQLRSLAVDLPVPSSGKLRPLLYEETSSSTYRSQGFGADRYARGAAERIADDVRAHGVAAEVHELTYRYYGRDQFGWSNETRTYGVLVDASPLGMEILRRKPGAELREVIRLCWKRGVNPRVYYPFLPHGYEERVGLDYFGGELAKASAAHESGEIKKAS